MDKMDDSNNSSINLSVDFNECYDDNIPHKIGFFENSETNNKNFFISSLHLLTNIYSLLNLVKVDQKYYDNNIYIPLWSIIYYKDNNNFEDREDINGKIRALNDHVFKDLSYDKNDDEPKKLIIR